MHRPARMNYSIRPYRIYLTVLAIVFANEFLVMLLLPVVMPSATSRWLLAAADAVMLTMLLLPLLWITVINPLRAVADTRRELLEDFANLQEEERRRLAADLHDEVGQSLTSVMLGLQAIDLTKLSGDAKARLEDLRNIVRHSASEVRRIANGLRPAAIDHLGLIGAVTNMVEDARDKQNLQASFHTNLDATDRFPPAIEVALYRIIQEAMTNTLRHAEAETLEVSLQESDSSWTLTIADDGKGFVSEPEQLQKLMLAKHLGLAGIAERTKMLGGDLQIDSQPGHGTSIRVQLPKKEPRK